MPRHGRRARSQLPAYLDRTLLDTFLRRALEADIGVGDVTSLATVDAESEATGQFIARAAGTIAGLHVAERVFTLLDAGSCIDWRVRDGEGIAAGDPLGMVRGCTRAILQCERLALNLLQRMSGIATATRALVQAAHPVRVRDTRKTAPGLSFLDKWAVKLGGGENHRLGLYDRFLIKDNHIAAASGVAAAIRRAGAYRDRHKPGMRIEVEVHTLEELEEALAAGGFDELLLDNMVYQSADGVVDTTLLEAALARVGHRYVTEASGNITLQSAPFIAATGVDYISCGALTHSVQALDIALELAPASAYEH